MENSDKNKTQPPMTIDEMVAMLRLVSKKVCDAKEHEFVDLKRLKLLQDLCTGARNLSANYLRLAVACQAAFREEEYVDYNGVLHLVTGIVFNGGSIKYVLKKVDKHRFDTTGRPFKVLADSLKAADDNDYAWCWASVGWVPKHKVTAVYPMTISRV